MLGSRTRAAASDGRLTNYIHLAPRVRASTEFHFPLAYATAVASKRIIFTLPQQARSSVMTLHRPRALDYMQRGAYIRVAAWEPRRLPPQK